MVEVKLDERILRDFKVGVFIGLRKANQGAHTAFFIDAKQAAPGDIGVLMGELKLVPTQMRKAYREILRSSAKPKKRKRRKKNAK